MKWNSFVDILKTIEKYIAIIGIVIVLILSVIFRIINLPEFENFLNENITAVVLFTTVLLAGFIHVMFEHFFGKEPKYLVSKLKEENRDIFNELFDRSKESLFVTHIYALPLDNPNNDDALEYLDKKEKKNLNKQFKFHRIIGIYDKTDIEFAKNCLQLKNKYINVEVDLKYVNLVKSKSFKVFPNLVIQDTERALLSFPMREIREANGEVKNGETRGLYLFGEEAVQSVLSKYWYKLKQDAKELNIDAIKDLENELDDIIKT